MILSDIAEAIDSIATAVIVFNILKWILILAAIGIALFFVIRATCKYQAQKNAEAFDYDYLAERTAEEVCKRMLIIEGQKSRAGRIASDRVADQRNKNDEVSASNEENE